MNLTHSWLAYINHLTNNELNNTTWEKVHEIFCNITDISIPEEKAWFEESAGFDLKKNNSTTTPFWFHIDLLTRVDVSRELFKLSLEEMTTHLKRQKDFFYSNRVPETEPPTKQVLELSTVTATAIDDETVETASIHSSTSSWDLYSLKKTD